MTIKSESSKIDTVVSTNQRKKQWTGLVNKQDKQYKQYSDNPPRSETDEVEDGREPKGDVMSSVLGHEQRVGAESCDSCAMQLEQEDYDDTFDDVLDCVVLDVGMGRGTSCSNFDAPATSSENGNLGFDQIIDYVTNLLPQMNWNANTNPLSMDRDLSRGNSMMSALPSRGHKDGRFEQFMDCVAFPERHLNCDTQVYQQSIDRVIDVAFFPERHLSCGTTVQNAVGNSRGHGRRSGRENAPILVNSGSVKQQSPPSKNQDFLDDVFEDIEAQCLVGSSPLVTKMLESKGDMLDYTCRDVETVFCSDDSYKVENRQIAANTVDIVERRAISERSSATSVVADVPKIQSLSLRQSSMSSDNVKKTINLLNGENEMDGESCGYNPATPGAVDEDWHRETYTLHSNRSLISDSSSVSTLSSMSNGKTTRQGHFGADNNGMELGINAKNRKNKKKKNFVQRLMVGTKSSRRFLKSMRKWC